jgi:Holliday junction resolvase RusA-like endonuclease
MINLTIPGEPCAKGRPRLGKFGTYTPTKTINAETLIKELYIVEHNGKKIDGQVCLRVKAYFKISKSFSKKMAEEMNSGNIRPVKRPDGDNILKLVSDALNGLAYDDDSQVVTAIVEKYYSDNPRVEIMLTET